MLRRVRESGKLAVLVPCVTKSGRAVGGCEGMTQILSDKDILLTEHEEPQPETAPRPSRLRAALPQGGWALVARELGAALTVAAVALPICISAGVLAYSPLGPDYAAQGAVAGLTCAFAGGIIASLVRSSSFVTNIPTNPTSFLHASFAASLLGAWQGDPAATLAAYPVFVLLVAFWQILFGLSGFSRIIKFTPYPVLGGFITGLGLLIGLKQLPVLFGVPSLSDLGAMLVSLSLPSPAMTLFGVLLVALMLVAPRISARVPSLLAGLVGGFVAFHVLRHVAPQIALGPTIGSISIGSISSIQPFDLAALWRLLSDTEAIKIIVLSSFILALLGTLDLFLDLRAAQNLSDVPIIPRRELLGLGIGNIVAAFVGGVVVAVSLSVTNANHRAGGRTRISTIAAALILMIALLFIPSVLFGVPMIVLSAILILVSIRSFDQMTLKIARDAFSPRAGSGRGRALRNVAIVVAVAAATVVGQPIIGAGVGMALAGLVFIADMSRPIVRRRSNGLSMHSKRVRSRRDLGTLKAVGDLVSVMELQGVLFFGNADDLATDIRSESDRAVIVILDFRRVSDVDVSGAAVLHQIARRCAEKKRHLILCGVKPQYLGVVSEVAENSAVVFMTDDLDEALEWAEETILRVSAGGHSTFQRDLAHTDLTLGMSAPDIEILERYLAPERYPQGSLLCRTGDPADRLWILTRGTVSIRVNGPQGSLRLASLAAGCSVGEMGMLEDQPRSADVHADDEVEAFVLTRADFNTIFREHPRIGQTILVNIGRQLAQRLRVTSEDLRLADQ